MISELAQSRMKKFMIVLDQMNADPEVAFYRCKIKNVFVVGVLFGPAITKELLDEMQFVIDGLKKDKGWI